MAALPPASLPALFGPHLARGVDTLACLRACENAGFGWFSGAYALDDAGAAEDPQQTMTAPRAGAC
jgi:hypothetical protein